MHCIFVYGTLKRGFCRHSALSDQVFLGLAKTESNYKLFDLGSYPGLVMAEEGRSIEGEVYNVDNDCLNQLDVIEGVDIGLYRRDSVHLLPPWNTQLTQTYIYLSPTNDHTEISKWSLE